MIGLPADGLFIQAGPRPTVEALTSGIEDLRDWASQRIDAPDTDSPATIPSGTLTLTQSYHAVEGEGSASDDLAAISTAGVPDGTIVLLRCFNAAHVITAKHATSGSGHIELAGADDLAMNDATMWLVLKLRSDVWYEVDRSYGGNKSAFRAFWGLAIGSAVQAYSAALTTLAGAITTAGQAMCAAANVAAQRTLLGLGTAALLNSGTSAGNVVILDGSSKLPAVDGSQLTNIPSSVVQVVNTQTGSQQGPGTGNYAYNDTVPTQSGGTEFMTLAITPKSATNKLRIEVNVVCVSSVVDDTVIVGLFQDATANALAAVPQETSRSAQLPSTVSFTHYMTAGTTSATTFKVRAGCVTGNTGFNGTTSARRLGGVSASSITITEIKP